MVKNIVHYFDKLEDRIRGRLSKFPIIYTLIGGVSIVLFWRGVWITADQIALLLPPEFYWIDGILSIAISAGTLLITGLFVSFFVNDTIILSGVKQDKKLAEKPESEVREEKDILNDVLSELHTLEDQVKKHETHS